MQFLIIADMHFAIEKAKKDNRQILHKLGDMIPTLNQRRMSGASSHIQKTFREAANYGPYEAIIDLGDRTHGTPDNTGLICSHSVNEAFEAIKLRKESFPEIPDNLVCQIPGNHDLGWALSSFARKGDGYLKKSLASYRKIYGPLFWMKELTSEINVIGISSEPFLYDYNQPKKFKNGENEKEIKTRILLLKNELALQLSFIKNSLQEIKQKNKKFILAVHEPFAMLSPKLQALIEPYKERHLVTLAGHVHARWLMNILNFTMPQNSLPIFKRYKIQMIPSVWGIMIPSIPWGIGAGWARIVIEDDGHINLYIYRTNKKKFQGIRLGKSCL